MQIFWTKLPEASEKPSERPWHERVQRDLDIRETLKEYQRVSELRDVQKYSEIHLLDVSKLSQVQNASALQPHPKDTTNYTWFVTSYAPSKLSCHCKLCQGYAHLDFSKRLNIQTRSCDTLPNGAAVVQPVSIKWNKQKSAVIFSFQATCQWIVPNHITLLVG